MILCFKHHINNKVHNFMVQIVPGVQHVWGYSLEDVNNTHVEIEILFLEFRYIKIWCIPSIFGSS